MKNCKSQSWSIDLIVAIGLFSTVIFIFFIYAVNQTGSANEKLNELQYDARIISNSLLSEGYPESWDKNNVIKIGILSENKINETKLKYFYELTQEDYLHTKVLFKIKNDYFFFLSENITIDSQEIQGVGKPGTNLENINTQNLIKITRYVIYKDKPEIAYLYMWKD